MKEIYTVALWSLLFLAFSTANFAQYSDHSGELIIGKWNLRSASFNGKDIGMNDVNDQPYFEFSNNGQVTFVNTEGSVSQGQYLIDGNRIVDPNSPELLNALIIAISNDELILSMYEDQNEILMIFELEGFASR